MNPISTGIRRTYLIIFSILFVVFVPLVILYSLGYRFENGLNLFSTGGIYLRSDLAGAEIYLNNKLTRQTSFFRRSYFMQNLRPANYFVFFSREGFYPWSKKLDVYDKRVTEAYVFNMPIRPIISREIAETLPLAIGTSTTRRSNPEYSDVVQLFNGRRETQEPPALLNEKIRRRVVLWQKDDEIHARWLGSAESIPYYFCHLTCQNDVVVYRHNGPIKYFDFYPNRNDLVIFSVDIGVFVSEIDTRPERNIQPAYLAPNADFVIENGNTLFVKDGSRIMEVETAF